METENKEKIKKSRKGPIKGLTLNNIPRSVHKKIGDYQLKIGGERGRFYDIKEAYVEFLKEHTKNLAL